MSVIIRLQNLPWSANALDIRQYFQGLAIPEGGVHIVGGEQGDAFIAFSTDEDARQAMLIDGGKIKEIKIKLFLSSRSEMQKVIETARAQSLSMQSFMQMPTAQIPAAPIQVPPTPPQTAPAMPPMPPISQVPAKTATPEIKLPPLPPLPLTPAEVTPDVTKTETEPEKKDQDTESISSKDAKRSRRGRSRSKSKNRSKSRDRSKSRERSKSRDRSRSRERSYRNKDRYRDRRRRDRSRSRDRRDRRKYRDRSRSRPARKSSRDRKRESDKSERNSVESGSGAKAVVPNNTEIPLPNAPAIPVPTSKPGFSNSGWVTAGAAEKSGGPVISNPIGFSIGKQPLSTSASQQQPTPPRHNLLPSPQQIPLPQQMQAPHQMPTLQQVPTAQPTPATHLLHLPQPPSFPQIQAEVLKDHDIRFGPMSFSNSSRQQSTLPSAQQNVPFGQNQPQVPQNEPIQMSQHESGSVPPTVGWPPIRPQMDPHSMGLQQALGGVNSLDKATLPSPMTMGMGMFVRPPVMPSSEKFQPLYSQQDPRMHGVFPQQQPPRSGYRSDRPFPQINNFSPQKPPNYGSREYSLTNPRELFSGACVEIRNMSLSTTNGDIRRFFQGLQIPGDGVKIITDKKGNKVGMAYVRFSKTYFKDMAIKKSGQMFKNSVVEVLHIDDNIFDKAADFSEYSGNSGNYFDESQDYHENYNDNFDDKDLQNELFTDLVIHEVPPYAKDKDIYNLFKGLKISDAFVLLRTGRKTATGYVRFKSPADARKALMGSSRLAIGYTSVKAAICYEHEFADARDRKNMEENDEEMMDLRDASFTPHESRVARDSRKHQGYDYDQNKLDPRYIQSEKRLPPAKGLLPTPNVKPFDARNSSLSNNFQSRFDRKQQDLPSRTPREDFHRKPYGREEFSQKPFTRENSRFQMKSNPRDDLNRKMLEEEDFYEKSQPHNEFNQHPKGHEQLFKKSRLQQYPPNTTKPTSKENPTPIEEKPGPKVPSTGSDNKTEKKVENQADKVKFDSNANKAPESKQNSVQVTDSNQNCETKQLDVTVSKDSQPVEQKEEIVGEPEKDQSDNLVEQKNLQQAKSEEINKFEQRPAEFVDTECIILRGLPFTANDRDILDFFSDEGLAPTQIHIMLDKNEKPAGDAFCEFNTTEEVARALTKNQSHMGRSLVAVEPVSREEMMEALGAVVPHPDHPHPDFPTAYPYPNFRRPDYRFPRMPLPPYQSRFPPRGRGRGAFRGRYHPPTERELETQNVNAFGKPGCVVALENVPFKAEVQDIIDFFGGFFVPRDNIIRRFDESGKPTGDARVCLSSPLEAHRAIRTLNYSSIFNRQIHLTLVP